MSARAPVFLCLHRYLCLNPGIYTATVPCLSVCAAGGLLPAGRLVTIASASPGGDRSFFQVKACGYHKNRDGCVVCKEAEGRFFKIHELEFCQQEYFVAKVPAPESE